MSKAGTKEIAKLLGEFLADTYVLYLKTQNFHWNVVDSRFDMLHKMFQEQYEDLAEAADLIAEQIRIVGHLSPGTMKEFLKLTRLAEGTGKEPGAQMVEKLQADHETICEYLVDMIAEIQGLGDEATADVLIERARVHGKFAWMLRSHSAK
jgi:starvation-inducible DNA-binding protein